MKKSLIILGVSAIAAVATKVVTSNVKKQKEEKGKFEFKGLFEKAAIKQAAKDSVEAVKGISKESLSLIGLKLLFNIFKHNRKAFNKIAIEMGVLCGVSGIIVTTIDRKKYFETFKDKKHIAVLAFIIDIIYNIVRYMGCFLMGAGIRCLIDCYIRKSFDSWIFKIILETFMETIVCSLLLIFIPSTSKEVA